MRHHIFLSSKKRCNHLFKAGRATSALNILRHCIFPNDMIKLRRFVHKSLTLHVENRTSLRFGTGHSDCSCIVTHYTSISSPKLEMKTSNFNFGEMDAHDLSINSKLFFMQRASKRYRRWIHFASPTYLKVNKMTIIYL